MSKENTGDDSAFLTPKEIQQWLMQEILDSAKAHELRVRDATELATAYALGELTPEEAHERFLQYDNRWGESLPGTHAFKGSPDDQLLASVDKARGSYPPSRALRDRLQTRVTKKEDQGHSL
jgi:hypothetical protein